ncbi:hypothetical protein B0T17DRAFT_511261 [Bombardia bombarda]|uniref:Uncharacterized protein n=1 Tax=Bombardia bombarda TaxID=252184 RepID=A0AA39TIM5_9PEZI|nr:hypothetical protein B0T17DRAFT_511261 [Bombardia bombarda]
MGGSWVGYMLATIVPSIEHIGSRQSGEIRILLALSLSPAAVAAIRQRHTLLPALPTSYSTDWLNDGIIDRYYPVPSSVCVWWRSVVTRMVPGDGNDSGDGSGGGGGAGAGACIYVACDVLDLTGVCMAAAHDFIPLVDQHRCSVHITGL